MVTDVRGGSTTRSEISSVAEASSESSSLRLRMTRRAADSPGRFGSGSFVSTSSAGDSTGSKRRYVTPGDACASSGESNGSLFPAMSTARARRR
jgi:hypothetical protein